MVDLERWKDEIIESITVLHDETKKIREYLEHQDKLDDQEDQHDPEQDVQEDQHNSEQDDQEDQDDSEQDDQEDQHEQEEQEEQEVQDVQELVIQKLDDLNESINILNTTLVESSIVVSISIIIALAFHYFMNQISKW